MRHRLAFILPIYAGLFTVSLLLSYGLRFDFNMDAVDRAWLWATLPLFIGVKLSVCALTQEWKRSFRHVSINDAVVTGFTSLLSATILISAYYTLPRGLWLTPRSIILTDCLLSILLIFGFRAGSRLLWKKWHACSEKRPMETALIFGTDSTAIGIWKMLSASNGYLGRYQVVGFIDPGPDCQNSLIGGQKVHSLEQCWQNATQEKIKHILVPTSTPGRVVRELLHRCQQEGINLHKIPTVEEIVEGRFRLAVRELDIDDLLRRPPTKLDLEGIGNLITNKRVLVTGGAGSIGSELCRQILSFNPRELVIFDHSEFGVFQMERELAGQRLGTTQVSYLTASILDQDAVEAVFERHKPHLVFHAAAYKHVPLMQDNPYAAIRNNVAGTKVLVDAAHRHHADRFVLISTDKAVRPTSVMGATKLLAEKYLQAMSQISKTKYITVRFGNVLNSVGSVVPTFQKQIEQGGPVTVTHEDMVRYFMTIPEAVQLVLQAGAVGASGNVLILEMGDPVKIVDLAKDMIALSGLSYPDDIDIEFTGLRPGEKMYEELFYSHEHSANKVHEKIILGAGYAPSLLQINADLQRMNESLVQSPEEIAEVLWQVVHRYVALDDAPPQSGSGPLAIPSAA